MEHIQTQASATSAAAVISSSPMKTSTATPSSVDENHITRCPVQIHCNLGFDALNVLKELRVDFNNMAENGMDLRAEMLSQNWDVFFARLHGPVYENLVKDFWRQAECDSHYVVSHVLGHRIVITEKTIAQLLTLPHLGGKRIQGKDNKSSHVRKVINKEIFSNFSSDKKEYKAKDFIPSCRTWHKIILGCINPRPFTSSSDYINANQKYMLYYLMKHDRICLPSIIFYYLRESI
jgi:hypothetical protein